MAKMAGMTAQELAQKQINAVNGAVAAYKKAVGAVTQAPGALAAQAQERYLSGVVAQADYWAKRVSAVTLQDWIAITVKKGGDRLGAGITAAQAKITAFWTRFLPVLKSAQATVKAMDKSSFEARMQRMVQMATLLHQAKGGG